MLTSAAEGAPCSSSDRMQLAAILAVLKQTQGGLVRGLASSVVRVRVGAGESVREE